MAKERYFILKNKLLKELHSQKNICFNNIFEKDNKLYILKNDTTNFSSSQEVRELCNINDSLEKYRLFFNIEISLERIVVSFNK